MKNLRPTIPIADWTLAVHLEATREIQNQEGVPAHGCCCEWCSKWRSCCGKLLPLGLIEQFDRVGVDLAHPTDLYKYEDDADGSCIRVAYHAVGKILSGKNVWVDSDRGRTLCYSTLREKPFLSMVVYPQSKLYDPAPILEDAAAGDLLRIDLRLFIPNTV